MNKTFKNICQMTQEEVKLYATTELRKTHNDITVGDGFVFAKGTFPVLLVAHMDTVHSFTPSIINYDKKKNSMSSPYGIGGDDRCGIYMILEIIKAFNCSVLFCEDEESGGIGAKKFIQTDLASELEFNYAIELDRKGSKDAVFYDCDNEDFEKFITQEFYKTAWGSFSDISVVAPFLKCAAVNLSCGYYNAHTEKEYVVLHEMDRSIKEVCKILNRTTEDDKFEYIECQYENYYGYYNNFDYYYYGAASNYYGECKSSSNNKTYNASYIDDDDEDYTNYYLIEFNNDKGKTDWFETFAVSEAEAVGRFLMWYPELCYHDIIDIMMDKYM